MKKSCPKPKILVEVNIHCLSGHQKNTKNIVGQTNFFRSSHLAVKNICIELVLSIRLNFHVKYVLHRFWVKTYFYQQQKSPGKLISIKVK